MILANDLDMLYVHQDCSEGLMEWKKERSNSNSVCHLLVCHLHLELKITA